MSNRPRASMLRSHRHTLRRPAMNSLWWVCNDPSCAEYGDHFESIRDQATPLGDDVRQNDESRTPCTGPALNEPTVYETEGRCDRNASNT